MNHQDDRASGRRLGWRQGALFAAVSLVAASCGSDADLAEPGDSFAFDDSGITVVCDKTGADITTSDHDISNVVVATKNGQETKFDNLSGKTYRVDMRNVATVWVKSADNQSGDGPGYGERFECGADGDAAVMVEEPSGGEEPAAEEPADDGAADDGAAEDGAADDGAVDDGAGNDDAAMDGGDGNVAADYGPIASPTGITVTCGADSIGVTTTDHDISNVVVGLWDGTHIKHDNLKGKSYTIDQAGVVTVWVKSADNDSGDGPGYGERFDCAKTKTDIDTGAMQAPAPAPAAVEVEASDTGIAVACTNSFVYVTTDRHEISNIVLGFGGDEATKYDNLNGYEYKIEQDAVETVWVKSGNNDSGDGPGYGERFECKDAAGGVLVDDETAADGGDGDGAVKAKGKKNNDGGDDGNAVAPVEADLEAADSGIAVACTASSIYVSTTVHDISNIVVALQDGTHVKYDNLKGKSYTVPEANVVTVWVKSGDNDSGDGPGYGERFDCTVPAVVGGDIDAEYVSG